MKKYIITAIAILLLTVSILPVSAAFEAEEPVSTIETVLNTGISSCADETQWYYRNNNGVLEKRLWSITEGRWLTAWMPADRKSVV